MRKLILLNALARCNSIFISNRNRPAGSAEEMRKRCSDYTRATSLKAYLHAELY